MANKSPQRPVLAEINSNLAELTINHISGGDNGSPRKSLNGSASRSAPRPSLGHQRAVGLDRPMQLVDSLTRRIQSNIDSLNTGMMEHRNMDIGRYQSMFDQFKDLRVREKDYESELKNLDESNTKAARANTEACERHAKSEGVFIRRLEEAHRRKALTDAAAKLSEELGVRILPIEDDRNGADGHESDSDDELEKSIYNGTNAGKPVRIAKLSGKYQVVFWKLNPKKPEREYKFTITFDANNVKISDVVPARLITADQLTFIEQKVRSESAGQPEGPLDTRHLIILMRKMFIASIAPARK